MYKIKKYGGSGSRSRFYIINNHKGFKEFKNYYSAEYARNAQQFLSEYNLAPKVYSEVGKIRKHNNKLTGWGYISERAMMAGCCSNNDFCNECEDLEHDMEDEISELCDNISEMGYYFADNHIANIGYIRRSGKKILVCIDTGKESLE